MIKLVLEVLAHDFGEVIDSPLILKLLSVYSKLYLNGAQAKLCESCHRKYYNELQKTGIMKAQEFEAVKTRTCKPKWRGLKYINKLAKHFNNDLITDETAIKLLNEGHLNENDFVKLPDGYGAKPNPVAKTKTRKKVVKNK